MDQNLNQANGKRPYQPPQLTTISLRPEEAVLGSCKIAGSAGPVSVGCQPMGVACNAPGS
jgi:hypothetical protein